MLAKWSSGRGQLTHSQRHWCQPSLPLLHVGPVQEEPPLQEEDAPSSFLLIPAEQHPPSQTQELTDAWQLNAALQEEVDSLTVRLIDACCERELIQSLLTQIEHAPGILAVAVNQPSTSTANVSGDDGFAWTFCLYVEKQHWWWDHLFSSCTNQIARLGTLVMGQTCKTINNMMGSCDHLFNLVTTKLVNARSVAHLSSWLKN